MLVLEVYKNTVNFQLTVNKNLLCINWGRERLWKEKHRKGTCRVDKGLIADYVARIVEDAEEVRPEANKSDEFQSGQVDTQGCYCRHHKRSR